MGNSDLPEALNQQVKLAILYEVVEALKDVGKTQIQKTVYFLQAAFGVPLNYSFRMHHYGPYSGEVETDISRLKMTGYLFVKPDLQGYGFHVGVLDSPEPEWQALTSPYKQQVDSVLSLTQGKQISDLELMATLHFVDHLTGEPSQYELIETVHGLKPKFSREYIMDFQSQLTAAGLLRS